MPGQLRPLLSTLEGPIHYAPVYLPDEESVRNFRRESDRFLGRREGPYYVLALGERSSLRGPRDDATFFESFVDGISRLAAAFADRLVQSGSRFLSIKVESPPRLPVGCAGCVIDLDPQFVNNGHLPDPVLAALLTAACEAASEGDEFLRKGFLEAAPGGLSPLNWTLAEILTLVLGRRFKDGVDAWRSWDEAVCSLLEDNPPLHHRLGDLLCGLRLLLDPAELADDLLKRLESGDIDPVFRAPSEFPRLENVILRRFLAGESRPFN